MTTSPKKLSLLTNDDEEGRKIAKKIAIELNNFLNNLKFSQNDVARKIGVSNSVISQIIDGEYKYNAANSVWIQIEKFLEKVNGEIFETELLRTVYRSLNKAFNEKKLAVISSCSGAGKTTAIERYCLINPDAIVIRVTEVFKVKYMLQKMLQAIGVEWKGYNAQQMFEALTLALHRKPRLFIIDEAERLHTQELEMLRDIYDEGNIGLVLVGLAKLRTVLKESQDGKSEELVQVYSRVAYVDIVNILSAGDVRMILDRRCPGHKISENVCEQLAEKYAGKGGLRAIIKIADVLPAIAKGNWKEIGTKEIVDATVPFGIHQVTL